MHSHKLRTDRAPIDDGIHAIPHGLDAIIAISSIRLALLPFQSLFTHKRFTRVQCIATPTKAVQSPTPISIEFAMSTGRESRIHTRWPSDALIAAHQRCYAFAIALPHSIFHTQQYSIHRFAESCHSSNLHSTLLYPTFNYIEPYYILHTHQYHSHPHFHSASPTCRFNPTSFQGLSLHSSSIHSTNHFFSQINSYFTLGLRGWAKTKVFKYNTTTLTKNLPILLLSLSLSLHFSQHLSLSFPFSLSNYLSFTHFYLSPISYTRIHSPFPIHYNHSLFYSQATHKSNAHHEHHSSPVKRFHLCETLPSV